MDKYDLDELLEDTCKTKPDELEIIKHIDVPDMNQVWNTFLVGLDNEEFKEKSFRPKKNIFKKSLFVAASIIIVSLFFSMLLDIPRVKAFRFSIYKTVIEIKDGLFKVNRTPDDLENGENPQSVLPSNSQENDVILRSVTVDEAKKKIPFKVLFPKYLPKNYELDTVVWRQYVDDSHHVLQTYRSGNDKVINISQSILSKSVTEAFEGGVEDNNVSEVKINGYKVLIVTYDNKSYNADWYQDNISCSINGTIPKKELIKIIESMK